MRSIFAGIEYAGKSTLATMLGEYYRHRRVPIHGDDHFTLPDASLSPESRKILVGLAQRHKGARTADADPLPRGHHQKVRLSADRRLAPRGSRVTLIFYGDDPNSFYYPNFHYGFQRLYETLVLEAHLPDVVLFHVTASDEEIARRMQDSPHEYPVVREEHIAEVKARFEEEIAASLFTHQNRTIVIDTTGKTPESRSTSCF